MLAVFNKLVLHTPAIDVITWN